MLTFDTAISAKHRAMQRRYVGHWLPLRYTINRCHSSQASFGSLLRLPAAGAGSRPAGGGAAGGGAQRVWLPGLPRPPAAGRAVGAAGPVNACHHADRCDIRKFPQATYHFRQHALGSVVSLKGVVSCPRITCICTMQRKTPLAACEHNFVVTRRRRRQVAVLPAGGGGGRRHGAGGVAAAGADAGPAGAPTPWPPRRHAVRQPAARGGAPRAGRPEGATGSTLLLRHD